MRVLDSSLTPTELEQAIEGIRAVYYSSSLPRASQKGFLLGTDTDNPLDIDKMVRESLHPNFKAKYFIMTSSGGEVIAFSRVLIRPPKDDPTISWENRPARQIFASQTTPEIDKIAVHVGWRRVPDKTIHPRPSGKSRRANSDRFLDPAWTRTMG